MPLSATSSHTVFWVAPADMTIRPPSGVYFMALERMFMMTWEMRSRSARISGRCSVPSSRRVWLRRWASSPMAWRHSSSRAAKGKGARWRGLCPESNRDRVSRSWTMWVIRSLSLRMTPRKLSMVSGGRSGFSVKVSA